MQQIGELRLNFTNSLLKPLSIREKYLEALRVHIGHSDWCAPCLTAQTLPGEMYGVVLEQELAYALDKASATSIFREISQYPTFVDFRPCNCLIVPGYAAAGAIVCAMQC